MVSRKQHVMPISGSSSVFKEDIFHGKVLFCTGGGSGICRGMTEAIMRHGANATIVGRKLDRLTQTAKELSQVTGRTCLPLQADVRSPSTLKEAVEKTLKEFGRIDFVICGAAGNFLAPIASLSENAFKTVIEIDTIGTFNTIKATLPSLRESKGAYIHVSATLHYHATPYQAHVSAAKAGVDALSAVLAIEEGPNGVRSNVIAPGPIAGTEGMDRLSLKNRDAVPAPTGRMGDIRDIENAAVFLFSDAATYITGQVLPVDGGSWHLLSAFVPYPDALLNPQDYRDKIKPRM
ncbi:2,4-dienoyl-CoA reductase [Crepidotus variabilis]|uniref:2,4-dienoyl-CoA reductase [(3E)-enoyl-CoA-producing] n=1 Tax=Crepidotus variabilis TaxID=179855 RepID=A0A9P6ECY6_9AGAR|nr:2,4-dienoyl-CoA reductase [Crepidotus variabilis]